MNITRFQKNFRLLGIICIGILGCVLIVIPTSLCASEQQVLVDKARITLESYLSDPDFAWLSQHMKDAKALFIVPQLLKGAFFVGGSGGSGVIVVRDEKTGAWSQPAFCTMVSASFGLQLGGQASELILMVMTSKGVRPFLNASFKLGIELSGAMGPMGAKIEGATPYTLSVDYLSFARSKGVFLGLSLEGAVIGVRNEWNWAYYGEPVDPWDILMRGSVSNPGSAELRKAVTRITK